MHEQHLARPSLGWLEAPVYTAFLAYPNGTSNLSLAQERSSLSPQTPQLINVRTAAAILSVCPATITRMIRSGRLPALHPTGSRSIRLDLRDVLRLAEPMPTPTEEAA